MKNESFYSFYFNIICVVQLLLLQGESLVKDVRHKL